VLFDADCGTSTNKSHAFPLLSGKTCALPLAKKLVKICSYGPEFLRQNLSQLRTSPEEISNKTLRPVLFVRPDILFTLDTFVITSP
jgi:hypothetical protein